MRIRLGCYRHCYWAVLGRRHFVSDFLAIGMVVPFHNAYYVPPRGTSDYSHSWLHVVLQRLLCDWDSHYHSVVGTGSHYFRGSSFDLANERVLYLAHVVVAYDEYLGGVPVDVQSM